MQYWTVLQEGKPLIRGNLVHYEAVEGILLYLCFYGTLSSHNNVRAEHEFAALD